MLKVVVIMTERYSKVLKKGRTDRNKLFFRSLAVFDRRKSLVGSTDGDTTGAPDVDGISSNRASVTGFSVDEPKHDNEEDEDDDELSLAALESLDAIEVFRHDQHMDTKIHHAHIPIDNFRRLLMLLLYVAPLGSQENLAKHFERLTAGRITGLRRAADSILGSFAVEHNAGIYYHQFNEIIPASLPYLFDGLNPLFEHFLFSRSIDLSRKKNVVPSKPHEPSTQPIPGLPLEPLLPCEGEILDLNVLSQVSVFIKGATIFRRLRPLYFGGDAGFSIGSLEQKVLNWRAPSILLVAGTRLPPSASGGRQKAFADTLAPKRFPNSGQGSSGSERVVFGVYLNVPWKQTNKQEIGDSETLLFQLEPIHEVFRASTLNTDYATFTRSGINFGSPPPKLKPVSGLSPHVALGPVSLMIDGSLEFAVFTHDSAGGGSFHTSQSRQSSWQDRFEIESLEVWGCGGDEEAEKQRAAWAFEEREAMLRRNLNLGKDIEADRALLEMAGLIGQHNASGGSMG